MSIEGACEDFLQGGDSGVFLVAVSDRVQSGDSEEVARTVLQEKYQAILVQLGWDLLSLLTPHLRCLGSHCWRLLCRITEVCSPKEMVLALLEQMEVVSDTSVFLLMLQPLQKVLLRLERETVLVSTLRSASSLVQQHYSRLEGEHNRVGTEQQDSESGSETSDLEPSGVTDSCSVPSDNLQSMHHSTSDERDVEGEGVQENQDVVDKKGEESFACHSGGPSESEKRPHHSEGALTVHSAVAQMLEFAQPFVEEIHQQYCSVKVPLTHWSGRQRECVTLLLSLLDYPLVACNLRPGSKAPNESRIAAESIMGAVVRCHCGCVKLMEWESGGVRVRRKRKGRQQGEEEDDPHDQESGNDWMHDDNFPLLPPLGLACFVYLVMVEGVERSYLPTIVRQDYLLHVNLVHVTTLLGRPEKTVTLKGLALLKILLSRAPTHSLPSYLLDDKRYLQLAELLTNLMITCVHKSVRQQCVPLLLGLISCFKATGRHRIYRSLFHSVDHAGVLGLLIHNIKNEVDRALKAIPADSPFLGPDLVPLLDLTLRVSVDTDLLKESDRVMAALNFLRYLLIRDKLAENQTGLWSALVKVRDQFMTPLRSLLVATKAHCQREVELRREEAQAGTGVLRQDDPEVSVEVRGAKLPNVNPEDEIKVLRLAQHHLDMMESIMVRVEELMDI